MSRSNSKDFVRSDNHHAAARGFTLIELMIAISVITTMLVGATVAMTSSLKRSAYIKEQSAAMRVADSLLAEVRNCEFDKIVDTYNGLVRDIELIPKRETGLIDPNKKTIPEAEFIIITDETPNESDYGRDIETLGKFSIHAVPDNVPDGIDLDDNVSRVDTPNASSNSFFPMDLNGDGDTEDDHSTNTIQMRLIPVIVLIRWRTAADTVGRYQAMTLIRRPD